jgi:hypothetical protein
MYTPPLLKKVISEYLGFNHFYLEAQLEIWSMSNSILAWGARLTPRQETLIEFHFIKNENKNSVKKMPICALKV